MLEGGWVEVVLMCFGMLVEFFVMDNGIGVKFELLLQLFDCFMQFDISWICEYGGLGLGLLIVKYLVVVYGGIVIVSSEGEG